MNAPRSRTARQPGALTVRVIELAALVYPLVPLYVRFAPFDFQWRPLSASIHALRGTPQLGGGALEPADLIVAFAVYVPLSFLWAGRRAAHSGMRGGFGAFLRVAVTAFVFAAVVEFARFFLLARPALHLDLIAAAAGILAGLWLWRPLGRRLAAAGAGRHGMPRAGALTRYFATVGVLAHVIPLIALFAVVDYYDTSLRQIALKGLARTGIDAPIVEALLAPSKKHGDYAMDGRLRASHPRILLPDLALWDGTGRSPAGAARLDLYKTSGIVAPAPNPVCDTSSFIAEAVCWVMTGNRAAGRRAIEALVDTPVTAPLILEATSAEALGIGWQSAFAFDLLYRHPDFTDSGKEAVRRRLRPVLRRYLTALDDDKISLWHSRTSVASLAWLIAVALDRNSPGDRELVRRSQAYFRDVIDAVEVSEAWPEGYNYWINSRALPFALACAAYINGLTGAAEADRVARILRRIGMWNIYAVRPDHRIEPLGDEGPRIDQKDETRRVIDTIAQVTRDPLISAYSRYLEKLHGAESYYSGYRWAFTLLNDPTVRPAADITGPDLSPLNDELPRAALFGRGALNLAYIRSGWGSDDTFMSFRAGATLTHHAHYDAGHFTLFKGAPLAVNSSLYGDFFAPNRLYYAIRTVAKNSILVLRPGERVIPNRFFERNVAAGGQRIVLPTGSAIRDVAEWRANLYAGRRLEGGRIIGWHDEPDEFTYVAADIAGAYNRPDADSGGRGGKVRGAVRELLYLRRDDLVLVRDRVETVRPDYVTKWVLHTVTRPEADATRVLVGRPDDGILETGADMLRVANGKGRLTVHRLAPADGVARLVGGARHRFYVEADGDETRLDGENVSAGANPRPWFDDSMWRIEIQSPERRREREFLIALQPSIGAFREDGVTLVDAGPDAARTVATRNSIVVYAKPGSRRITLRAPGEQRWIYLTGLRNGARVAARAAGLDITARTIARDGTAALTMLLAPGAEIEISISEN